MKDTVKITKQENTKKLCEKKAKENGMRQMNRRPSAGFDSCYTFTADPVLVVQVQLKYKNYIEYKVANPPQMEIGAKHSPIPN